MHALQLLIYSCGKQVKELQTPGYTEQTGSIVSGQASYLSTKSQAYVFEFSIEVTLRVTITRLLARIAKKNEIIICLFRV